MKEANSLSAKRQKPRNPFLIRKKALRLACGIFVAFVVYLSAQAYRAVPAPEPDVLPVLDEAPLEDSQVVEAQPVIVFDHPPAPRFIERQIRRGDTVGELLGEVGVADADINRIVSCQGECRKLHHLMPGTTLGVRMDASGGLLSISQELSRGQSHQFHFRADQVFVTKTPHNRQVVTAYKQVVIRAGESPISAAMRAGGIKESTVLRATQILEYDIDFWRNIQPEDSFEVLYEQIFINDEYVNDGRIFALEFINRGRLFEAYLHADGSHYEADGAAIQKQFLKAPLRYQRISSNFSNARKHPILGYTRAHKGVDYAAPRGTPVRATANGTVTRVKRNDRAAGNFVVIAHPNSFETRYLHLSGFADGIVKGAHVLRGSTIGYVGSTGYSTGPHLHYEIIKSGRHMNPLAVPNPSIDSLEDLQRNKFMASVEAYRETMRELRTQDTPTSVVVAP